MRKPRALSEIDRWKATEYRQFLLYTGIVTLKNSLPALLYNNFLVLFVAISILVNPEHSDYYSYSGEFLMFFVQEFSQIYGRNQIVYNVHSLVHLASDTEHFGSLDSISAFPFENFLGGLKKMVKKAHLPLQQVIRRLGEEKSFSEKVCACPSISQKKLKFEHNSGPLPFVSYRSRQFHEVTSSKFCIKCQAPDNCVYVDGNVVLVENIVQEEEDSCVQKIL